MTAFGTKLPIDHVGASVATGRRWLVSSAKRAD
jgi:hypothetical protein